MARKNQRPLADRVAEAAEAALAAQDYVSAVDVLIGIRWLDPGAAKRWRQGQVDDLEQLVQTNPNRLSEAMTLLRRVRSEDVSERKWALERFSRSPNPIIALYAKVEGMTK